tara:strand:- start:1277 stop:2140 length:864 start_codon:yes stop_codon:yes gene_type:complete
LPTTIASGFSGLRTNLELTGLQKSTISTRQKNVRIAVENGFDVLDSFLAGSYSRSTIISPLSECDIDIFVVIESKYYTQYQPSALLDRLRAVLKNTYPSTPKISRNGQAVTISFTDFKVDVVPCFNRKGGGFIIPNSITQSWLSTNPTIHQSYLSEQNRLHGNNLIPLVKMMRGWNRCINNDFSSFYIELCTAKVLTNVRIDDFTSGVRYVFDKGREVVKYKIIDPAGFGDQINPLNNISTVNEAVSRFQTAYNRAIKAEEYAQNGNIRLAFEEWRKIFPRYFPAYG